MILYNYLVLANNRTNASRLSEDKENSLEQDGEIPYVLEEFLVS